MDPVFLAIAFVLGFAARIRRGLARDKARIAFPRPLYWAMWLLGALPPSISDLLLRKVPRKE